MASEQQEIEKLGVENESLKETIRELRAELDNTAISSDELRELRTQLDRLKDENADLRYERDYAMSERRIAERRYDTMLAEKDFQKEEKSHYRDKYDQKFDDFRRLINTTKWVIEAGRAEHYDVNLDAALGQLEKDVSDLEK